MLVFSVVGGTVSNLGRNSRQMKRFDQIEGLRGYLALWVLVGHLIGYSGITLSRPVALFTGATKAVDVFIILSGFVITHMMIERPEPYLPYITRRFFRLWPVLVVACLFGWLTYDLFIDALTKAPGTVGIAGLLKNREASIYANPTVHILAHASMLHGAIPDKFLPGSDGSFVGTAWSTSLEWQFYLLAPAAIWLARKPNGSIFLLLICATLMFAYDRGVFGHYYRYSTIVGACGYFLIGITSRLSIENPEASWAPKIALAVSMTALLYLNPSPIIVWGIFYTCLVSRRSLKIFDAIFSNKPARYLGSLSYSIYLVHIIVLGLTMWIITRFSVSLTNGQMVVALIPFIPVSIAISAIVNVTVEKPGMLLGRKLAQRLREASSSKEAITPA